MTDIFQAEFFECITHAAQVSKICTACAPASIWALDKSGNGFGQLSSFLCNQIYGRESHHGLMVRVLHALPPSFVRPIAGGGRTGCREAIMEVERSPVQCFWMEVTTRQSRGSFSMSELCSLAMSASCLQSAFKFQTVAFGKNTDPNPWHRGRSDISGKQIAASRSKRSKKGWMVTSVANSVFLHKIRKLPARAPWLYIQADSVPAWRIIQIGVYSTGCLSRVRRKVSFSEQSMINRLLIWYVGTKFRRPWCLFRPSEQLNRNWYERFHEVNGKPAHQVG